MQTGILRARAWDGLRYHVGIMTTSELADRDVDERLHRDGFCMVHNVVDDVACDHLISAIGDAPRHRTRAGRRGLFSLPSVVAVARAPAIRALIDPLLGLHGRAVRATLFDKVEQANWRVPWHRDRTIALRQRLPVPGFSAWSVKEGVPHATPPRSLLEAMVSLRLHLDPVDGDNAPLLVLPGSHLQDGDVGDESLALAITAPRGSVLVMRPLLVHASAPAQVPGHRRVLHLDFAAVDLPGGLEWAERW